MAKIAGIGGERAEVARLYGSDKSHRLAVVLWPWVCERQAGQMLYALMIGVGDAIGAQAPPEVVVTYQLPHISC